MAPCKFQDFHTPAYSETDLTGGGFGLSYAAMNATDVRTELGARFDDPTVIYNKPLILFGRLAWAHDFVTNPALSAAFEALPGGTFTVNGAPIPHELGAHHRRRAAFPHAAMDACSPSSKASSRPARRPTPAPARCAIRGEFGSGAFSDMHICLGMSVFCANSRHWLRRIYEAR